MTFSLSLRLPSFNDLSKPNQITSDFYCLATFGHNWPYSPKFHIALHLAC